MRRKTHYETLGVTDKATAKDIKRAYRSKARKTHPDKGGNADEFAEAAKAYEVLSNPERRQLYDATGQDRERSINEEATQVLKTLFREKLANYEPGKVLIYIGAHLNQLEDQFIAERRKLNEIRKTLEQRREKITSTAEVNLAHLVIDDDIKAIDQTLESLSRKTEVKNVCQEMLKAYSEQKEPEREQYYGSPSASMRMTSYFSVRPTYD